MVISFIETEEVFMKEAQNAHARLMDTEPGLTRFDNLVCTISCTDTKYTPILRFRSNTPGNYRFVWVRPSMDGWVLEKGDLHEAFVPPTEIMIIRYGDLTAVVIEWLKLEDIAA